MPIIFYHPSMTKLAHDVAKLASVPLGEIEWGSFPDGWPDLFIKKVETVRREKVVFMACFDSPSTVLEQFAVIEAVPRYFAESLQVVLPFFPVGTMERINRNGEVATAVTMSRLLSSISPCRPSGPMLITTFDIHALQERFYFGDAVIANLQSAIPLLHARLAELGLAEIAIAFPDAGARKRFGEMFPEFPLILCDKQRIREQRHVVIREGEPRGKNVIIVDDLVQTGGTLIESASELRRAGATSVSAYATHGVFPQESWRRFTPDLFAHVWITDSCPQTANRVQGLAPFEVLSLAPLIVDSLWS
jgi:ribose-phosphate pyrophosphokinase